MSAIDPTCLPWQIKHDFDTEGATTIIGNVDGEIIDGTAHHTFDFVARTLDVEDDSQSRSVAVANAAFIVRACNSHGALIAQLEFAVKLLSSFPTISGTAQIGAMRDVIARAKGQVTLTEYAAIAKARGAA
jgi:hypothetical protein